MNLCPLTDDGRMERPSRRRMKIEQSTRWFKYDRDWFVCKQAALRSSCATLREWSHNLHPPSLLLGLEPVQSCLGVATVMSEQKVPRSVEQRIVIKFLVGENVPSAAIHLRRHSSPYCCWSLWWISADGTFSSTRNLITMRCSTLRGTFCSLITLATSRQDWTGSNPSRREGWGFGFTLSRSHSCCAVRLLYIQISPGHIWTTLYLTFNPIVTIILITLSVDIYS